MIGEAGDLEAFMFEQSRQTLAAARHVLFEAQDGRCFYCGGGVKDGHVDHFIPWIRYPRDLAENFVLADSRCNLAKSDMLAAPAHIERWAERNRSSAFPLAGLAAAGLASDPLAISAVARWAYGDAARIGARLWHSGRTTVAADRAALMALG